MPTSFASTLNIKNIAEESNQSVADKSGLPDLIIEDIYAKFSGDMSLYYMTIKNIGNSNTVGFLDYYVKYTAQWKLFGFIPLPIKIRYYSGGSVVGQGAIVSPGESHDICFLKTYFYKFRDCKLSFSAEINNHHEMEESNYDNNFYDEVISLSIPNSKPSKIWSITFHVFEDLDRDKVFDENEPSPPITKVHFKIQDSNFRYSRFRLIGFRGEVTFWFVPYPFDYRLIVQHDDILNNGLGIIVWRFDDSLQVNEGNIRSTIYIPLTGSYIP